MPRKKKKREEPLPEKISEKPAVEEPKPIEKPKEQEVEKPKPIIWPVRDDDKRKEVDDIEQIQGLVNIKYGTQDVRKITKVIVYNIETRNITEAFYKIDLKG
jgi:hypothetical protein